MMSIFPISDQTKYLCGLNRHLRADFRLDRGFLAAKAESQSIEWAQIVIVPFGFQIPTYYVHPLEISTYIYSEVYWRENMCKNWV